MHGASCQSTFIYRREQHAGLGLQFADPAVNHYSSLGVLLLPGLVRAHSGWPSLRSGSTLSAVQCPPLSDSSVCSRSALWGDRASPAPRAFPVLLLQPACTLRLEGSFFRLRRVALCFLII